MKRMISMVDKNRILISYYRDGESKISISRRLQISRKTVRKYIRDHEQFYGKDNVHKYLEHGISSKPNYDTSSRKKLKLIREIELEIDLCLLDNQQRRNSGMHKQQMKKIDIYEHLLGKGYKIGYTTICNYIRLKEAESKECFIKQTYCPGITTEFDWGDVKLYIMGKLQNINLSVFTSAFSNHRWGKLFYRQDTLAFSQGHIDYFAYLKGVHKELVYDNMRVAIRKFVGKSHKEPTCALLELSNYYKFDFRFCNIAKGNEKGHVERSVEYVRRKAFSKRLHFDSLEEANAYLLEVLETLNNTSQQLSNGKTANELFEEEEPHLYKVSLPYKCFKEEHAKVDKYSTAILSGNRYSVPDFLVGKLVKIKAFAEKLDIYYNNEFLCSHIRSYGAHSWTIDIDHYLTTLIQKPGALKSSLALNQASEEIKILYFQHFTNNSKDFIELLQYCKTNCIDWSEVIQSVSKLVQISPLDISRDKILIFISKEKEEEITYNTNSETYQYSNKLLTELSEKYN
jgi:transposase